MDVATMHGQAAVEARTQRARLGATAREHACDFLVWAPARTRVDVLVDGDEQFTVSLRESENGYFHGSVDRLRPGTRYYYLLDGDLRRPDPASQYQPDGVHGPSEIISDGFPWTDDRWRGLPLSEYIIYELHVGTFTPEGTLDAIVNDLDRLQRLGITALELMPVAEFPGGRNWGYDGVYPFAVDASYGGPEALKRVVNAAHQRGMAVVLDVVYNHLGPEGNYLRDFGPYFTSEYKTPWGDALNFDNAMNEGVRRFFIENALMWITEFHIDALRLDAVHAIYDRSALPFLKELADAVHMRAEESGRPAYLIAESDLNDSRLLRPWSSGGYGLDAQWSDDFHHSLHTLLTGETSGYYKDFGKIEYLARALQHGWTYSGQYSPYRKRRHGNSPEGLESHQFVICTQNHDQIGNRMLGDRLSGLASFEELKVAAAALLLAPYVPLLFMGEEYADPNAFLYFVSHGDPELARSVSEGRRAEFAKFAWLGNAPDPQDPSTFERSKLNRDLLDLQHHRVMQEWYAELIRLRKTHPALRQASKNNQRTEFSEDAKTLTFERWNGDHRLLAIFNFSADHRDAPAHDSSHLLLNSADQRWLGQSGEPLAPSSCLVLGW